MGMKLFFRKSRDISPDDESLSLCECLMQASCADLYTFKCIVHGCPLLPSFPCETLDFQESHKYITVKHLFFAAS